MTMFVHAPEGGGNIADHMPGSGDIQLRRSERYININGPFVLPQRAVREIYGKGTEGVFQTYMLKGRALQVFYAGVEIDLTSYAFRAVIADV